MRYLNAWYMTGSDILNLLEVWLHQLEMWCESDVIKVLCHIIEFVMQWRIIFKASYRRFEAVLLITDLFLFGKTIWGICHTTDCKEKCHSFDDYATKWKSYPINTSGFNVRDVVDVCHFLSFQRVIISSPEPKAHLWAYRIGRHLLSSSTLFKHLLRNHWTNQSNFIWSLYGMG